MDQHSYRIRKVAIITFPSAVLIGIIILLFFHFRSGVKVIVTNHSGVNIKDITLNYIGGITTSFSKLKTGDTWKTSIQPGRETSLVLEFSDDNGKKYSEDIGVYLEKGYHGDITIDINPNGKISRKDNIRLPYSF
jgi:hypothetical protein